jgi:hypothetical protein
VQQLLQPSQLNASAFCCSGSALQAAKTAAVLVLT